MMYFAVHHLGADGGLQITGSHNPPDYNGFKMMLGTRPFYGAQIQEIGKIAGRAAPTPGRRQGGGRRSTCSTAYLDRLAADFHGTRSSAVVWDAGNGAAGPAMAALAAACPAATDACSPRSTATSPTTIPIPPSRTI